MKKRELTIIEWISFILFILLYVILNNLFVEPMTFAKGLNKVVDYSAAVTALAFLPLAVTIVIFLIRYIFDKKNGVSFFSRVYWISAAVILLFSNYGACVRRDGGYVSFVFLVPLVLGALYWSMKHKKLESEARMTQTENPTENEQSYGQSESTSSLKDNPLRVEVLGEKRQLYYGPAALQKIHMSPARKNTDSELSSTDENAYDEQKSDIEGKDSSD